MEYEQIENKIGYTFRDKSLLDRAFTHTSSETDNLKNYQSIEFLGDSIVGFVTAKRLMTLYPDKSAGDLTNMRKSVVSTAPLSKAMDALDVSKFMRVGKAERSADITSHDKIKEDLFEAITAAIFLDSGSVESAECFVLKMLDSAIQGTNKASKAVDFKTELNEYAAKHSLTPEYAVVDESGPDNAKVYVCSVALDGKVLGQGKATKKKSAEQIAAREAMKAVTK